MYFVLGEERVKGTFCECVWANLIRKAVVAVSFNYLGALHNHIFRLFSIVVTKEKNRYSSDFNRNYFKSTLTRLQLQIYCGSGHSQIALLVKNFIPILHKKRLKCFTSRLSIEREFGTVITIDSLLILTI